ncbi:cellulose binding domain-containing protein [Myroides sp.]|uniref:cellulose binding domain-containing protein n=1 Tax=Myroides sp. TaxID=1874736 RepID=UPI0039185507
MRVKESSECSYSTKRVTYHYYFSSSRNNDITFSSSYFSAEPGEENISTIPSVTCTGTSNTPRGK